MPNLPLQHIIFTRVERAYSPRNVSGYQVVYQSPTLDREVTEIEKRLQCFDTGKGKNERYQFFWTERGQAVIAKTVPLTDIDPEVIDSNRRAAFLAHALVIDEDAFASSKNDPFAIFDVANNDGLFVDDVDNLLPYLNPEPPQKKLSIAPRRPEDASYFLENWSPDELAYLFHLGLQARTMSKQGQSLLLLADDPSLIENLLSLLLWLIPSPPRKYCTFDSWVDSCYPSAGSLWAMGSSKDLSHPNLLPVRVEDQRLVFKRGGDRDFPSPKAVMCTASSRSVSPDYAGRGSSRMCA